MTEWCRHYNKGHKAAQMPIKAQLTTNCYRSFVILIFLFSKDPTVKKHE